jgi:UDP-N-acetylglucosamine 2-epimerase
VTLLVAFGTRPEYLKIEPLLKYWKSIGFDDWKVWLTFQHEEMCKQLSSDWEFKDHITKFEHTNWNSNFNQRDEFYGMGCRHERLDSIVAGQLLMACDVFEWNPCNALLVQGDTASAFACALAAFHRKIPIIHLEAGLRSYDNENPYPEEFYRRSISMMSSINLCPTWQNAKNLEDEKVPGYNFVTGNTILDSIKDVVSGFQKKILCTLHRRENQEEIKEWFQVLEDLAKENPDHEFILPIHPNPEISKHRSMFQFVHCIDAVSHAELINILKDCYAVCTDSGGIAEESSYLGKRILLCRKATERPEAWTFYTWCKTPSELKRNCIYLLSLNLKDNLKTRCPFGDGSASRQITDILINEKIININ